MKQASLFTVVLPLGLRPDHQTQTDIVWNQQWDGDLDIPALKDHWSQILK